MYKSFKPMMAVFFLLFCITIPSVGQAPQITLVTNAPYGSPPSGWQTGDSRYCYNLQTNNFATNSAYPHGSITFSLVSGALPPGLRIENLNSNNNPNNRQGVIDDSSSPLGSGCVAPYRGVPTTGTYTFTLKACDNIGGTCAYSTSDPKDYPAGDPSGHTPLTIVVENTVPMPVAAQPQTFIDTTFHLPTGGTTWNVGCTGNKVTDAVKFQTYLNQSEPGDVIVLTHGCTYYPSGAVSINGAQEFQVPIKNNPLHQWIYVVTDDYGSLPAPGTRISPSNVPQMATIAEDQGANAIGLVREAGSTAPNYWRFIGIEIKSASNSGTTICGACPCRYTNSSQGIYNQLINCGSSVLFIPEHNKLSQPIITNNITIDRCYIHGDPTHDVTIGVDADIIDFAIVDSWVSDIHRTRQETQAIIPEYTPGPIKIDNNYLSAAGESVFVGGSGAIYSGGRFYDNPYVTRDVQISNNQIEAQVEWDKCGDGGTVQPGQLQSNGTPCPSGAAATSNQWIIKNDLEFKSIQRALVTGNLIQHSWASAQDGANFLLEPAGGESGNSTQVTDVTFENNIVRGGDVAIVDAGQDYNCDFPSGGGYPNCNNESRTQRIIIDNNLLLVNPSSDGVQHDGIVLSGDDSEAVFTHNTVLMSDGSLPAASFFFGSQGFGCSSATIDNFADYNVYILNNYLGSNPNGDCGEVPYYPAGDLGWYEPAPSTLQTSRRLTGNVLKVPNTGPIGIWPTPELDWNTGALMGNDAVFTTASSVCGESGLGNYQLSSPDWTTKTTDGYQSGVICSALCSTGVCGGVPAPALGILTLSPPAGTVGIPYNYALAASGGVPPYSWSIVGGSLPPGLEVVGAAITGVPQVPTNVVTLPHTYSFTVQVEDSDSTKATAPLSIRIVILSHIGL